MEGSNSALGKKGRKLRQFSGDSTKSESGEVIFSESEQDSGCSSRKGERQRCERNPSGSSAGSTGSFKFASLGFKNVFDNRFVDGEHKSAFSPYKPRTILTNLQRGNVQTESVVSDPFQLSFHQKAGKGELTRTDMENSDIDVNEVDRNGLTPLMWACAYGQVPTAAMLLRAGAMHSVKGHDGEVALHLASAGGHTEIIRLLLQAGASVNEIDDNGNTPMMYAAHSNHAHSLNELLNNSGDITLTNLNDDTALSIAIKCSCKEAQSVMEGYLFMLLQPT